MVNIMSYYAHLASQRVFLIILKIARGERFAVLPSILAHNYKKESLVNYKKYAKMDGRTGEYPSAATLAKHANYASLPYVSSSFPASAKNVQTGKRGFVENLPQSPFLLTRAKSYGIISLLYRRVALNR